VLDRWRPSDGAALRRFDLDPDTARFFGYTVKQAQAMPDSHSDSGGLPGYAVDPDLRIRILAHWLDGWH
jgi:hypothetical protein